MSHGNLFCLPATLSRRQPACHVAALVTWLVFSVSLAASLPATASAQTSSCHKSGIECIPLSKASTAPPTCFGASLGFSHTALLWANDSVSLPDVTSRLKQWEGLSSVPECWAVVQPYICSVYMPKCDNDTGRVGYPSRELCERTREPCRLVTQFVHQWPDFLRCSQPYFKQNCRTGAYDQLNYNTTGRCDWPLVRTEQKDSWWSGLEGCGVQCQSPLYSDDGYVRAHAFVAFTATLCLLSTLFTILTFMIDWQNASKYPGIILFFINFCFLMATVGWMIQFSGDTRKDIVCRADGTQRKQEPRSGETVMCIVVFVMIYYFTMAALLWFVMLSYAWHVTFRALGTPRDDLSSKTAYFHLVSWSLPLVLTIVCLAISEIDGDPLSGICFVGYHNHSVRAGFVLVPVACVIIGSMFFLMRGLRTLVRIRKDAPEFVGEKATSKILETIIRIGVFSALALVFVLMTFAVHIYIFINESKWNSSLDDYLYCLAHRTVSRAAGNGQSSPKSCSMKHTPNLVAMETNMFAFFGAGILMSSWSWTKASLYAWERMLRKVFNKPSNKPVRLEQHRMIAQAYERRQDMNNGRLCVTYHSTHEDPLGMKFDLHSLSSNMSHMTNFAHNMPHLVQRPAPATLRRYSDSDITSVVSRRYSQGSQQLHDLHHHGTGQLVYMERDNSSNNGSVTGDWRMRRRRRRKRRKKLSCVQPILGPVLSGKGFGPAPKPGSGGVLSGGVDSSARRGSESSILSKASAQGIRMHMENQGYRLVGSSSSLTANDRIPAGGTASGSDLKGPHASRSRRRKLPRLAPLSRHRHRSLSSSRSSLSQFGLGLHGMHHSAFAQHQAQFQHHHHQQQQHQQHQQQNPYAHLYAGYDYAQFYASMGYPQMAYPFWNPYFPYPPQFPPPPPPPHHPGHPHHPQTPSHASSPVSQLQPQHPGSTSSLPGTDFSLFTGTGTGTVPGPASSTDGEGKRVVAASTSRRSEVTIETQQTELISLQKVKAGPEYKIPPLPLSDDSIEDLNSSQLEDSAEEGEDIENDDEDDDDTGDTTGDTTGEAEMAV